MTKPTGLSLTNLLLGVLIAFTAQVAYDVISNAGDPYVWQNHLLGGITVAVFIAFLVFASWFVPRHILHVPRMDNERSQRDVP